MLQTLPIRAVSTSKVWQCEADGRLDVGPLRDIGLPFEPLGLIMMELVRVLHHAEMRRDLTNV